MNAVRISPGALFEVVHPFIRDTYTELSEDGPCESKTWRPGIRYELVPPDDGEAVADALGSQVLTVVSVHKPGRFPERVFYTRQWRDPNGRVFGKNNLRMTTTPAFLRLIKGYRVEFRVSEVSAAA